MTCPKCGHAPTPANPLSAASPRWCLACRTALPSSWAQLASLSSLTRARRSVGMGSDSIDRDPVKYAARMVRLQAAVDRVDRYYGWAQRMVIPGKPGELVRIVEAQRSAA